jgi:hypothetical protein
LNALYLPPEAKFTKNSHTDHAGFIVPAKFHASQEPSMSIRLPLVLLAAIAAAILSGCGARDSGIAGAHTEGGIGSPFYAEIPYSAKEGQKQRIYLFGKVAHYEAFLKHKDVPENAHKKFIGKGVNRETIVVQDLTGFELKDNPDYTTKLLAKYQARHASELAASAAKAE